MKWYQISYPFLFFFTNWSSTSFFTSFFISITYYMLSHFFWRFPFFDDFIFDESLESWKSSGVDVADRWLVLRTPYLVLDTIVVLHAPIFIRLNHHMPNVETLPDSSPIKEAHTHTENSVAYSCSQLLLSITSLGLPNILMRISSASLSEH